MERLIDDISKINDYVSVAANFSEENLFPFLDRVQRNEMNKWIGVDQMNVFIDNDSLSDIQQEAIVLAEEAMVNIALGKYVPHATVLFGDDGITISEGEHVKTAEWWQIRDLRNELYDTGYSAIDRLLLFMEENKDEFPNWVSSKVYTIQKELIVSHTSEFNEWCDINNSRRVFLSFAPHLRKTRIRFIDQWLNNETVETIQASENAISQKAKTYLHAAMVSHASAMGLLSGGFIFGDTSIYMKHPDMPWDKSKGLDKENKVAMKQEKELEGDEFLKLLKKHVEDHPDTFHEYNIKTNNLDIDVFGTKSIVSF